MPRAGKSKPSKKSSEFNQLDFNGLSWDSLTGVSVPSAQEQQSSATSKPASASRKNPFSSPSISSLTRSEELMVNYERMVLDAPPLTFKQETEVKLREVENKAIQRAKDLAEMLIEERPSRSTTTTPAVEIQLDWNGLPGLKPHSSGTSPRLKNMSD